MTVTIKKQELRNLVIDAVAWAQVCYDKIEQDLKDTAEEINNSFRLTAEEKEKLIKSFATITIICDLARSRVRNEPGVCY